MGAGSGNRRATIDGGQVMPIMPIIYLGAGLYALAKAKDIAESVDNTVNGRGGPVGSGGVMLLGVAAIVAGYALSKK